MVARPAAGGAAAAVEPSYDDDLSFSTLMFEDDDDEGSNKGSSDEGPPGSPHDDSGYPDRSPHPNRARSSRAKPRLGEVGSRSPPPAIVVFGRSSMCWECPTTVGDTPRSTRSRTSPPWHTAACDVQLAASGPVKVGSFESQRGQKKNRGRGTCKFVLWGGRVANRLLRRAVPQCCQHRDTRDSWRPSSTVLSHHSRRGSGLSEAGRGREAACNGSVFATAWESTS